MVKKLSLYQNIFILTGILAVTRPLFAETGSASIQPIKVQTEKNICVENKSSNSTFIYVEKENRYQTFSDWINERKFPININRDGKTEKEKLRRQWEQALGVDIFYPYFKADALRKKTEEKTAVRIFNLKGKAELRKDEAKYIFNIKF